MRECSAGGCGGGTGGFSGAILTTDLYGGGLVEPVVVVAVDKVPELIVAVVDGSSVGERAGV